MAIRVLVMRLLAYTIAVTAMVSLGGITASAHTVGLSWMATTSPYVIDIGYDPTEFHVGGAARFDFLLHHEHGADNASYDHVWVRVIREEQTLLAVGVRKQSLGPTTLLYQFTEPGSYTLEASFRDIDGNDLAVKAFPLTVTVGSSSSGGVSSGLMLFVAGLCVGGLAVFVLLRRRG